MLKLRKYYKQFILFIVLAICFLFVEAMCDLKLPDYMSDIVNIGVQSNGIEDETPTVITQNSFEFITTFMTEQDKNIIESCYQKINKGNSQYVEEYPIVESQNIYILKDDIQKEMLKQTNSIFGIASKTVLNVMNKYKQDISMNAEEMYQVLPEVLSLTDNTIYIAREQAKADTELSLSQTATNFSKMYYDEVGIDIVKTQMDYIINVGIKMLCISLLGVIAAIIVGYLGAKVGAGLGRNLRKDVFEKVETFSSTEFDKFAVASLITRTTNDVTQIQNITIMGIRMLAFAPIMGIGALIMLLNKTTQMSWTLILGCVVILIVIGILFKFVLPKIKMIQKLTDKLNLVSKENLSGIMVIKAFGTQEHEEKRFDSVNREVTDVNQFVARAMSFMIPCMMLIMNLLCVLILWVGAKEIAQSGLQVGDMMAVMQYAMQVIMSFLMISIIFIMLPRATVSAERINEVLETESSIKNSQETKQFIESKKGYVEFKNVTFKYDGADETVLDNVTFTAKPGQTTAFIGSTGSGKSTLINLVPRFFDATEGEVLVNGVNVKDVKLEELHEQIGYIPQKGNLLVGTIESNLKYGNDNASDELIEECVKVAQAQEFIKSKEQGYKTEISQNAKNVSGGQKQRLSIARALVKNAPIYIFDDSFSALDFKTDSNLRKALKDYARNSTLLVVAQRVSTIMNAEQIVVLHEGKIVGIGTHQELLKNCSQYYEIASSQLSKEELENEK